MLIYNIKILALYRIFKEFDNFTNSASNIPSINMNLNIKPNPFMYFQALTQLANHFWIAPMGVSL